MLVGRFLLIVPALAIAGSLARKQTGAGLGGHVPHRHAAVRRPAHRRRADRRRPHVLPRRSRSAPSSSSWVSEERHGQPLPPAGRCSTRRSCARRVVDSFVKLDPRHMARNPVMFVVEIGSVLVTFLFFRDLGDADGDENVFAGLVAAWLWFTVLFANFAEAMAEGRGKAQAATLRKARTETMAHRRDADGTHRAGAVVGAARRRRVRRVGGRDDPVRRRDHRGHRLGRRVGDHRRVGPRDPRVRRRPLGGHRRHPGAVRPDRRAHHRPRRARRSSTA